MVRYAYLDLEPFTDRSLYPLLQAQEEAMIAEKKAILKKEKKSDEVIDADLDEMIKKYRQRIFAQRRYQYLQTASKYGENSCVPRGELFEFGNEQAFLNFKQRFTFGVKPDIPIPIYSELNHLFPNMPENLESSIVVMRDLMDENAKLKSQLSANLTNQSAAISNESIRRVKQIFDRLDDLFGILSGKITDAADIFRSTDSDKNKMNALKTTITSLEDVLLEKSDVFEDVNQMKEDLS